MIAPAFRFLIGVASTVAFALVLSACQSFRPPTDAELLRCASSCAAAGLSCRDLAKSRTTTTTQLADDIAACAEATTRCVATCQPVIDAVNEQKKADRSAE